MVYSLLKVAKLKTLALIVRINAHQNVKLKIRKMRRELKGQQKITSWRGIETRMNQKMGQVSLKLSRSKKQKLSMRALLSTRALMVKIAEIPNEIIDYQQK